MKKLVSIILPVYNVEYFIERCLNSIINQSYSNFEVIIIDDGTTDNSIDLCQKYCHNDHRFTIIHQENRGLSEARNTGINAAQGDYLMFIDSDDFVAEDLLHHLVECLENNNSDIAICDPVHYYPEKSDTCSFVSGQCIRSYSSREALCELFYQRSFLVSAWGKLYKRSLFDNIRFPKDMLFEDSAIMYLLFEKCHKITYSDAKLYAYVHRENSITTKKFSKHDLDILTITDAIVERYHGDQLLLKAAISYKVSACFRILLNAPNNGEYQAVMNNCKRYIYSQWHNILFDRHVRLKNKLALVAHCIFNPFIKLIYSRVNRWE